MRTEHEEEDIWRDTLYWEKGRRRERELRVGLFELRDGLKDGWMLVEGEN
jgi:hypothetical protein